jgi:hypothetical protein
MLKKKSKKGEEVNFCDAKIPRRDLSWSELDDAGKIERLKEVTIWQYYVIQKMSDYMNKLINHDKMFNPIEHPNAESYEGFGCRDIFKALK